MLEYQVTKEFPISKDQTKEIPIDTTIQKETIINALEKIKDTLPYSFYKPETKEYTTALAKRGYTQQTLDNAIKKFKVPQELNDILKRTPGFITGKNRLKRFIDMKVGRFEPHNETSIQDIKDSGSSTTIIKVSTHPKLNTYFVKDLEKYLELLELSYGIFRS